MSSDPWAPADQPTADDRRWEREAFDAAHASLTTVEAKAEKWSTTISAILGAFALAAFIKGPEAVKDIPTSLTVFAGEPKVFGISLLNPALFVVILIFVAAALLMKSIYLAAIAGQGIPTWKKYLDGPIFRRESRKSSEEAIENIATSRRLTLVAAVVVFVGLGIAWSPKVFTAGASKGQSAIVLTTTSVLCGRLVSSGSGGLLLIPEGGTPTSIASPATITLVDSCPDKQ